MSHYNCLFRYENLTLALSSAQAIGVNLVNIDANDLTKGTPHLVLGNTLLKVLTFQVKHTVKSKICIIEVCLLKYYFESHLIYKYIQTVFNQLYSMVPYVDRIGLCHSVATFCEIYVMRHKCHERWHNFNSLSECSLRDLVNMQTLIKSSNLFM